MAVTYTVQTGDTLYTIARRYGTTVEKIVQANNLANPDLINAGQVLIIPQAGDTGGTNTGGPAVSPDVESAKESRRIGALLCTLTTDRRNYEPGSQVKITLTKTNVTNRNIVLRYRTTQRFDFTVRRGAEQREVWRWSNGRSFAPVTATVNLAPGESQVFRATWDQRNNGGQLVTPGNFTIEGINVAEGLSGQAVARSIVIRQASPAPAPTPTATPCPAVNILVNPSFERWPNPQSPPTGWTGSNLARSTRSLAGNYAVEMGASSGGRAVLAQRVDIEPGRLYELVWHAAEHVKGVNTGRFILFVEVFFYDRPGAFVGRTEPRFSQDNIPNDRYQRYSISTGRVPASARVAEVRFSFEPGGDNLNTVVIDDVSFRCLY